MSHRRPGLVFAVFALTTVTSIIAGEPSRVNEAESRERAARELKQEQEQRILKIIPNFNTSFVQDAAPLSPAQKFHLALKGAVDPFTFVATGMTAGIEQAQNSFPGYGQGGAGYAKRFGAAYADNFSGTIFAGAVFPVLLRQDPRYFRKGTGSFAGRLFYSMSTTVRAKNDKGRWVPNYSNVLGNIAAGGLANAYYPEADRGAALTFQRAFINLAYGMAGSVFVEFWPDISSKLFHKHKP